MENEYLSHGRHRIVGIGASAGGLQALEELLDNLQPLEHMAVVVIQHLSPDFDSLMDQLLARRTDMPVALITDGAAIDPGKVYLLPPGKEAIYSNGRLLLTSRSEIRKLSFPIDEFFRSLAQNAGESVVAVVLSGTGSDGSLGVKDVHASGGKVIVQSPDSATFDGMPQNACNTGVVDLQLSPKDIAKALNRMDTSAPPVSDQTETTLVPTDPMDPNIRRIFVLLHDRFDLDFTHYRSEMILRRIERRIYLSGSENVEAFVERLESDSGELENLYQDMLIGVTSFFRDAEVFESLEKAVLPQLIASVPEHEEFRCWAAGAATGQEAYSLAIMLWREFDRIGREKRIRVFASDVHEASLTIAGRGIYRKEDLTGITEEELQEYFIERHDGFHVAPELRKMVVFTPHNVIRDAPFTRMHLITCRNLLIYLTAHVQQRVLSLFHFALHANGVLCLGISETLGDLRSEFQPLDEQLRIFRKQREVPSVVTTNSSGRRSWGAPAGSALKSVRDRVNTHKLMATYDLLLERVATRAILISADREILHVFGGASVFLNFGDGRPQNDLLEVLTTDLRPPLSLALLQLRHHGGPVEVDFVECEIQGETIHVRLVAERVEAQGTVDQDVDNRDILIRFEQSESEIKESETTRLTISQIKTVENLERELQASQESLQETIGELQALNEEAQSTNEQLTASNEELQSTNEELHSVNEELYTVNAEHQRKIDELTELNDDIDNLLTTTNVHTLFLDSDLKLRRFTPQIAELFNLIPQDIGRSISTFTHKLQEPQLAKLIEDVINGESAIQKEVKDKSGQWYLMRIFPYLARGTVEGAVVTFVDVTSLQVATEALKDSEERFDLAVHGSNAGIWDWLDVDKDELWCSARIYNLLGLAEDTEMTMSRLKQLTHPDDRRYVADQLKNHLETDAAFDIECRMQSSHPNGYSWFHIRGAAERKSSGRPMRMAGSFEDVTDRRIAEQEVQRGIERRDQFLAMLSHELRNPLGAVSNATALLSSDQADSEVRHQALGVVQRQLAQMSRLLDDLLDVSRITHGKIELRRSRIDLRKTVADALSVVQSPIDVQKMNVTTEILTTPIYVNGDSTRLEQMTVNLLTNALKYTPDGGDISIQLDRTDGHAVLKVKDSGVGIPDEKLSEIFSLFYQSDATIDRSKGGMGVGLTLVKAVVELHGGSVACHSDGAGQGTEFQIRIPEVDAMPETRNEPTSEAQISVKSLVLVEDIADARQMFAALLELRGLEVHQAADGQEGLDLIERIEPDAAIIDIGLPLLDGHEVARRLRSQDRFAKLPLVALTGYGQDSDRRRVNESGFDVHLVKPLNPDKLDEMLHRISELQPAAD